MAELTGKAISELPESTTVNNSALVALSENGASKKMTLATLVGNLLKKTGDTMSGPLTIADASIVVQDTRITSGTTPSSDIYGRSYYLNDSNGFNIATWQVMSLANGREGFQLVAGKRVNNVNKFNYIRMNVDANGDPIVELSGAAAWRKALGLCYAVNNTFTNSYIVENGFVSNSTTEVIFTVNVPLSMENISTVTVTSLSGVLRGISGYLNSTYTETNFATASGYTVTATKRSANEVQVVIKKSSAYTNVDNNTPVSYAGSITLKFT